MPTLSPNPRSLWEKPYKATITPILQVRHLMPRGVKSIAQGHTIASDEIDSLGPRAEYVLAWAHKCEPVP